MSNERKNGYPAGRRSQGVVQPAQPPCGSGQGRLLPRACRQDGRAGGGVGLGQDGHLPGGHGAAAEGGAHHQRSHPVSTTRNKPGDAPVDIAALDRDGGTMRHLRGGRIGMIFQEPMSSLSPVHTIGNQVEEALRLHQPVAHGKARGETEHLLDLVGFKNPKRAPTTCIRSSCRAACASAPCSPWR